MALNILLLIYFFVFCGSVIYANYLFFSRKKKIDYLFSYLTIVFLIESLVLASSQFKNQDLSGIYFLTDIVNLIFFSYYVKRQFPQKLPHIVLISILISVFQLFLINWKNLEYVLTNGIISSIYLIILSLLYFYMLIKKEVLEEIKITDIPGFWLMLATLLNAVFFLFRLIPRFYFQEVAAGFMESLRILFSGVNILCYLLISVSLYKYSIKNADEHTAK